MQLLVEILADVARLLADTVRDLRHALSGRRR